MVYLNEFAAKVLVQCCRKMMGRFAAERWVRFLQWKDGYIFAAKDGYRDPGTKIVVPRALGEPVLHDGGTALSGYPNRYPF